MIANLSKSSSTSRGREAVFWMIRCVKIPITPTCVPKLEDSIWVIFVSISWWIYLIKNLPRWLGWVSCVNTKMSLQNWLIIWTRLMITDTNKADNVKSAMASLESLQNIGFFSIHLVTHHKYPLFYFWWWFEVR